MEKLEKSKPNLEGFQATPLQGDESAVPDKETSSTGGIHTNKEESTK
jgi:hypothetical protein